ncbi:MAG: hypothetical protein ACI4RD_08665 [Kiritimatiellia bacterium]
MKGYWLLTAFAAVVLGAAAVWLGGLNQDEGWYLYAANLVQEGKMPFRDFAYTQGPLLPYVYSAFTWIWRAGGLLGARLFTLALGVVGIVFAAALARRHAPAEAKSAAALTVCLLLGANLYHLYYLAMPKTYALASLFVLSGCFLASYEGAAAAIAAGLALALAAGTRISLGALLVVVGLQLLVTRRWRRLLWFCLGGFAGLALVYLPFLCDAGARAGLVAAQRYHAARGGADPVWTVGSLSRLVRWYLPVFVVCGLGVAGATVGGRGGRRRADGASVLLWGFLTVLAVQMLAPFPYEDYQVPVMGLLAAYAAVRFAALPSAEPLRRPLGHLRLLLVLGLAFANSFGSPLLERWMTNGQDRLWPLRKERCELAQLRDVARRIESLDPGGRTLLTQDTYLAVETNRKVPEGLEMGPFSLLSDAAWRQLLTETAPAECAVAAMSGYAFAIEPPVCGERPVERQLEYWGLLKERYELADRVEAFGQNATPLLLLKRK